MIQIAVCEDDKILLEQLADQVREVLERHSVQYRMELFGNAGALLSRSAFDILFLDIEMEPISGLEAARKLRRRGDESRLIFITAYRRYAVEAYDVQAFHYLVKPVEPAKLESVVMKLVSLHREERQNAIAIRQGASVRRVRLDEIIYLEVLDKKIYLHTGEEAIPFYGKLDELTPKFPEVFFRCHRSYIVNLGHVQCYDKGAITLDNEEEIPLSKRRHKTFGVAFLHYLRESGDVF